MNEKTGERNENKLIIQCGDRLSAFAISRRGASHVRENKPCQDAVGICCELIGSGQSLIMAVADGHGGRKYDLSQFGAHFAVQAAIAQMKALTCHCLTKGELLNWLKYDFSTQVLKQWREYIGEDIVKREPDGTAVNLDEALYKRYGTTLLVMLAVSSGIFLCQLGDGDIVLVDADGNFERPLPSSSELLANETHSLSSNDSGSLWRIRTYSIDKPVMVVMSSDGLSNCFEEDEYKKFNISLYRNIQSYGMETLAESLPKWLDDASMKGSGDDISIACAIIDPYSFNMG